MSLQFIPFEAAHVRLLTLPQQDHALMAWATDPANAEAARKNGVAMTAVSFHNPLRVAGCAGLQWMWPGRALAWTLIGDVKPTEWTAIVRQMGKMIDGALAGGARRVEANVRDGFAEGEHLMRLLRFEREGLMRAFSLDGADFTLWARTRVRPASQERR